MTVKLFAFMASILLLIAERLAQAAAPASGRSRAVNQTLVCNNKLLNALRLNGLERGERPSNNTICGLSSRDNCCSTTDEIKILRSWNAFSRPKILKFAEDMDQIYKDFIALEPALQRLNLSQIEYHFDNISWRRTNDSQCFSGKYFLEQANYDLLKGSQNVTEDLISAIANEVAGNFSNSSGAGVIAANQTARIIRELFRNNTQFTEDLLFGLESPFLADAIKTLAQNLTRFLSLQSAPLVVLPTIPTNQPPFDFFNSTWKLQDLFNATVRSVSSRFFIPVLQTRVSDIHVASLLNYLNGPVRNSLTWNYRIRMRMLNVSAIIEEVSDELFADQPLKRYFGWFLSPTSRSRYIRVYKYLENRFYKAFADSIARSGSLSQHAQYAVLKEVMAAISDSALRSVLWASYGRITGALVSHFALNNYTQASYMANNNESPGALYLELVKANYNNTWWLDPHSVMNPHSWWTQSNVRGRLSNLVNIVNGRFRNRFRLNTWLPWFNTVPAMQQFNAINLGRARFAEYSGDNKRVCATVMTHKLVREAIFNEQKFSYCLRIGQEYKSKSLAATLGPLTGIANEVSKILKMKSSFYCAACSSRDSMMIDVGSNSMLLSSKFCFDFVQQFRNYLNWKFTTFQNFQFKLFQYISCFGRDANLTDALPYQPFNNLIPDNFTAWSSCNNVTSVANVSSCAPVCSQFSLTTFSPVIEGDRRNLRRLYNYGTTVLRQYGIMFGTFEPTRNYTNQPFATNTTQNSSSVPGQPSQSTTSGQPATPPRILEERRRSYRYNPDPEPRWYERQLQGTSSNSTSSSSNSTNKTNGTNGTNVTVGPTLSPALLQDVKIALLSTILKSIDKSKAYTRPEHYNHDEMGDGRIQYQVSPSIADITNMTTSVSGMGVDPTRHLPKIKFDELMFKVFMEPPGGLRTEPLDAQVVKDCVRVDSAEVKMFNEDFGIEFDPTFKPVDKQITILENNDRLFERYRHKPKGANGWTDATPNTRNLVGKQIKQTGRGSFVSNLLFKVLF